MLRRKFIGLALATVIGALLPCTAFAAENEAEHIVLTDELAVEMAQGFADTMYSSDGLIAKEPVIFCNESGEAIGYIVSFFNETGPNGYIIFDNTDKSLISEYVVEDGVLNPFVNYNALTRSVPFAMTSENSAIVKTDMATYAAVDVETGEAVDNYGKNVNLDLDEIANNTNVRSVDPSTWNDIFIDYNSTYYTLLENKWVTPFLGRSQTQITNATGGTYACVVTALIDCAEYYDPNFGNQSLKDTFFGIWNHTNSYYDENGAGTTTFSNMGPGFSSYMSSRGVSVGQWSKASPSWSDYKSTLNNWNMAIFGCGINKNGNGRVGHGMSVQGYMVFKPNGINEPIYTLGVHDGWNTYARNLSFYFTRYTDTYGAFFS